jgi:hypothetical protein
MRQYFVRNTYSLHRQAPGIRLPRVHHAYNQLGSSPPHPPRTGSESLVPSSRDPFNDLTLTAGMNGTSAEQFLPDLHSIKADVQYLRHLRKRLWSVDHRISQAAQAIPALEKGIEELDESRRVSLAATVSGSSYTLAEYRSNLPANHDSLRRSLEAARCQVDSARAQHKALQKVINTTLKAVKAKYELVHPIHRLPRTLLSRIFALVVSEEYAAADYRSNTGKKVRPLVSPAYLSLVCHYWRDIAYAAESLWNRILVTPQEPPTPFRATGMGQPAFVLVGGNTPSQKDESGLIARQIRSIASQEAVHELAYSGISFTSVRECLAMLPNLKRLSLTYTKPKSNPVVITLPETLDKLTDLSCFDAYPTFPSTLPSLETLAISVRAGGTERPQRLDSLLAKAPNLKSLLLARTPYLEVGSDIEHHSITSIKAHPSALKPLANALRKSRLPLPNLSSLELLDTNIEVILSQWEEMFAEGIWTSQISNLRLVCLARAASSVRQDIAHEIFAPFPSLRSLSIVREDRPELLLSASRRASLSKLTHIKLERSACDGDALLKEVKQYNDRQEVLRGEVSRLTHIELFNCPNVVAGVMKQLRLFRDVENAVFPQVRKVPHPPAVPRLPPHPPTPGLRIVRESLQRVHQPVRAEGCVLDDKSSLEEVPVRVEAPAYSELAPPGSQQLEAPVPRAQDEIKRPDGVVVVPRLEETQANEPPPPYILQRRQTHRTQTSVRRQRWSGVCL